MTEHRYAMIMAGGAGTRLWPLSRAGRPKQLVEFIGRPGQPPRSLLQLAAARLDGVVPPERRVICTGQRHREAVREALPAFTDDRILGEPAVRDTVNAIGLAAAVFATRDPDAVFAVLTSDHVIEPQDAFAGALATGFELIERDPSRIVTFSITPTHPATQYGYVELAEPIEGFEGARAVEQFVEKPDLERARAYVESGRFGWNAGMFLFHARTFLSCLERFLPESHAGLSKIQAAWGSPEQQRVLEEVYPTLPKISVDYAVMEPASRADDLHVCAVEMPVTWLDVGSWPSFAETLEPDASGNRVHASGPTILEACRDSLVVAEGDDGHTLALLGCDGLVVVRTSDATLVMPAERAQDLKQLHERLPEHLR